MSVDDKKKCNVDEKLSSMHDHPVSVTLCTRYKEAFEQLHNGQSKEYNTLVSVFANTDLQTDILISHIQALRKCVVLLKKEQESLVGALLASNWSHHPDPVGLLFANFIAELVSAQTIYIKPCVHSFIKAMVPKLPKDSTEEDIVRMKHSFKNIHSALCFLAHVAPLCTIHITDAISKYFPYFGKSLVEIENYVINILNVSTDVPNTRYKILSVILDHMLQLDVQIPKADLEELMHPENEAGPGNEVMFGMDEDRSEGREQIDKLDQLMVLLFTYVSTTCSHGDGTIDWTNANHVVIECMQLFEDIILLTHQSSHVQFVVFFLASLDQVRWSSFFKKSFSEKWESIDVMV